MWSTAFRDLQVEDVLLAEHTSIRIGGRARHALRPQNERDVIALLHRLRSEGLEHITLGGGSNSLFTDEDILQPLLLMEGLKGCEISEGGRVAIGAGVGTSQVVARMSSEGLAGVHVLAGVPGQIGGAVAMNAGTRYGEIAEVLESVDLVLPDGEPVRVSRADLPFAYRHSGLPVGAVVTRVHLRLSPMPKEELRLLTGRWLKEKQTSQPVRSWNFGCMFKNPPSRAAGQLIDSVGLKGTQVGQARISSIHGNFIENLGQASFLDVLALLERCESEVSAAFGVQLEREVRVISR
ncbi:MAG TPA: UDP-N-acetylmuramate dehydrogenase [Planctomycetota bacterium]|nr:UDP-N-acetylmuramate dehydrogenase [Planctomycetota bacterium]